MHVDMNAPVEGDVPEGTYLAEVKSAKEKTANSGNAMIAIEFRGVEETFSVYDNIMLMGKGWGLGRAKLVGLGVGSDFSGDLDLADLIGRRVYLHLAEEEYQGRKRLKVDITLGTTRGTRQRVTPKRRRKPTVR